MTNESEFLGELQDIFLQEASDLLTLSEDSFMRLEQNHASKEELEKVFRFFHNLKGTSAAVGFDDLADICHKTENLLTAIRNEKIHCNSHVMDVLLKANDAVSKTVELLKKDKNAKVDYTETVKEIQGLLEGKEAPEPVPSMPVPLEFDEKLLSDFYSDISDQFDLIESSLNFLEQNPEDLNIVDAVFRSFHTIKSSSSIMGFKEMEELAHKIENILDEVREKKEPLPKDKSSLCFEGAALLHKMVDEIRKGNYRQLSKFSKEIKSLGQKTPTSPPEVIIKENQENKTASPQAALKEGIKVDADKLDRLIDSLGELVISETMISQSPELKSFDRGQAIIKYIDRLGKITRNLQEIGMSLRMVPIRQTFKKMNRLVRDLSKKLDKEILLETSGEDTELDKTVADKISDPLMHMVRNSIDHGIEHAREQRLEAGKNPSGKITLNAYHKGGSVCLEIKDDGRGLDADKILNKALEKGIVIDGRRMSQSEIFALIFEPGFSTAEKVTDVSGRGVGMDVVRRNIEEIHGTIDIESEKGKGTTFLIKIPNTLAIIEGMVIMIGHERFVVPTYCIARSIHPTADQIVTAKGRQTEMFNLDGEILPLFRLSEFYAIKEAEKDPTKAIMIIVEEAGGKIALMVDRIIRQQQFVIKPLTGMMKNIPGISGGTIMPDGQVGLILDSSLLVQHIKERHDFKKECDT